MKIIFTGAECCGKTTLAKKLSEDLNIPFVEEISRNYLKKSHGKYAYEDVLNMALLQMAEEEKIKSMFPSVLICDTDILTYKIWCEDKFHKSEKWLTEAFLMRNADIYFLCKPDFPWQFDPLREDAARREELYQIYKKNLQIAHKPFIELEGNLQERIKQVKNYLFPSGGMY